jgi:hypothetical protein
LVPLKNVFLGSAAAIEERYNIDNKNEVETNISSSLNRPLLL